MPWAYLLRRVLVSIPVVIGVSAITFTLMHTTGGDYVPGVSDDPRLSHAAVEAIRHEYGLDQPWWVQYGVWLWNLLHLDFGRSMIDGIPLGVHIADRLPNTLELTLTAIVLAVVFAIPIGALSAIRRGTAIDHVFTVVSVGGYAVPEFWLGLLVILLFGVEPALHWGAPILPTSGAASAFGGGDVLDRFSHLILPASVLAFGYLSIWSRFSRSSMLEVLSQDYVRTARAKGMGERRVVYVHALRNAVMPLVTLVGLELPGLVSGGVIVEVVFGWPGIGRFLYERALAYDYTTVMGLTTFAAVLVVAGNLLADVVYALLDPRIRY
ncbi:MAG TPA: ABC transporter permease [Candidatus Dormibacteraeota bacterium]